MPAWRPYHLAFVKPTSSSPSTTGTTSPRTAASSRWALPWLGGSSAWRLPGGTGQRAEELQGPAQCHDPLYCLENPVRPEHSPPTVGVDDASGERPVEHGGQVAGKRHEGAAINRAETHEVAGVGVGGGGQQSEASYTSGGFHTDRSTRSRSIMSAGRSTAPVSSDSSPMSSSSVPIPSFSLRRCSEATCSGSMRPSTLISPPSVTSKSCARR